MKWRKTILWRTQKGDKRCPKGPSRVFDSLIILRYLKLSLVNLTFANDLLKEIGVIAKNPMISLGGAQKQAAALERVNYKRLWRQSSRKGKSLKVRRSGGKRLRPALSNQRRARSRSRRRGLAEQMRMRGPRDDARGKGGRETFSKMKRNFQFGNACAYIHIDYFSLSRGKSSRASPELRREKFK